MDQAEVQRILKRRYAQTVSEIDKFGRTITVGRLSAVQQLRAAEFGGGSGSEGAAAIVRLVCAVRQIGGDDLQFPRSRAEVEARLVRLESEGIDAATEAVTRLNKLDPNAVSPAPQAEAADGPASQLTVETPPFLAPAE